MPKETTQSYSASRPPAHMAISPTSPAPCQGPKGFLHCLVHRPHTPAKPTALWDESTAFCLPGLRSSLPSSDYTPHTSCPYLCNYNGAETRCDTQIRDPCHSGTLQLVPPATLGLGTLSSASASSSLGFLQSFKTYKHPAATRSLLGCLRDPAFGSA